MESYEKEWRRSAIRFVALALAVQLLLCLFASVPTLERVFPVYLRLAAKSVSVGDRSFAEYYPIRKRIPDYAPEVLIIGVDFHCAETYALLPDLLESLKNDVDIGTIITAGPGSSAVAAEILSAEEEEARVRAAETLTDVPALYTGFLLTLSRMKSEYPPQRQFGGTPLLEGRDPLEIARAWAADNGRAVLLLVDTNALDSGMPLRLASEDRNGHVMAVQCRYTEGLLPFGEKTPGIFVVDSDSLSFFDALYTSAARGANGGFSREVYSDIYSTDVSFLIINGTPAEEEIDV